ncbi:MAG: glycosyltransferase family 1 protein [Betaproteobacteria bacterium]|jgi:glycosyltransferase involved in cell wall biosynthesis|nr:glycosyltransferase family 1 protein [Betaproteobacteria bacterium]
MVTETYPPEVNGVARTIGIMVDGLRARGHIVQLVRPRQRADSAASRVDGPELMRVAGIPIPRYSQLRMGVPAMRALLRAWQRARPDVVHVATEGPLGWAAISAARRLGIPAATDFHTNFHAYSAHYGFAWLSRPVTGYLRYIHNRADCTMVPTEELAETLAGQGFERLRVVGRGIYPQVFSPKRRSNELRRRWGASEDTLVVLCVSRFAPEKNFPLVIEAYDAMRRVNPRCRLVLVGDGPLRSRLERQGAGCVIAGRLVNGELSEHYASADAFLFASTTETFGNVTLEAMASGLGIVAYRYAAARQYLEHERSALLAPFDNRGAFIEQAERLARDPPRARALGQAARRIAEGLSWEQTIGDFEAVLRETLARAASYSEPARATA